MMPLRHSQSPKVKTCFQFQGLSMPENGGEYTYLLHGIHTVVSYLYCYMTAIVMKPAPVAILTKVRGIKGKIFNILAFFEYYKL